jgi:hypothetical protein
MKMAVATFLVLVALGSALAGCATPEEKAAKQAAKAAAKAEQQAQAEAQMRAAIPADSPLQKIKLGMSEGEVTAILGQQNSIDAHATGKAYNPFNFAGRDTVRTTYYFKGIGRVEFSSGSWGQRNGVIMLYHDPDEPGYRRTQ